MRGGESEQEREAFRARFAAAFEAAKATGRLRSRADLAAKVQRSGPTVGDWFKPNGALPDGGAMIFLPGALGCNGHWLLTNEGAMHLPVDQPALLYYRGALGALGEVRQLLDELGRRWAGEAERARARAEATAPLDPGPGGRPAATEQHLTRAKKKPHRIG